MVYFIEQLEAMEYLLTHWAMVCYSFLALKKLLNYTTVSSIPQNGFLNVIEWCFSLKAGCMAMHACQTDPTDTATPCLGSPQWACIEARGMPWGRQPFCPHFSTAYWREQMVRLHSPFFWILGLGVSGCQMFLKYTSLDCLSSSIAGLQGLALSVWSLLLLCYLHLAVHCQSDKGGHLVPSVCTS